MITKIKEIVDSTPNKFYSLEGLGIWLNNSNNFEGEDMECYGIGYQSNKLGVFCGYDDFFSFDELDDYEIEEIYDAIITG